MPLGTEEQARRIRTRARARQWMDTGGFDEDSPTGGGIELDPYTRQFSRMHDIAEERFGGVVPEDERIFIREFEAKEEAWNKRSPFKRVQKWDKATNLTAPETINFEETEAWAERADFVRRWISIRKRSLGMK